MKLQRDRTKTREQRKREGDELKRQQSEAEALIKQYRGGEKQVYPSVWDFPVGILDPSPLGNSGYMRVIQVIDENNVIMEGVYDTYQVTVSGTGIARRITRTGKRDNRTRPLWVRGMPTKGLTDSSKYEHPDTPHLVWKAGTHTYATTDGGQKTIALYVKVTPPKPKDAP